MLQEHEFKNACWKICPDLPKEFFHVYIYLGDVEKSRSGLIYGDIGR